MKEDRISVLVKFPADLLAMINAARGSQPRMGWIVDACREKAKVGPAPPKLRSPDGVGAGAENMGIRPQPVERPERERPPVSKRTAPAKLITGRQLADKMGVQIGFSRSGIGSRLKS